MKKMKDTILSGMRPTGKLHIGHLEGVLSEWKKLQEETNAYYFVADWHALTTNPDSTQLKEDSLDMVKDWIAYGIDPKKSTIFLQSQIPEHTELTTIFSMLVNLGRLERLPTFNEYILNLQDKTENRRSYDEEKRARISYGFLGYPVLQSADILVYKANKVPVGEDQLPHLELTRELARKFNNTYENIFEIPEPILGHSPRILGIDGRKMSKSYDNTINPNDERETLTEKIKQIKTDTNKIKKDSPGNPYECQLFELQEIYSNEKETNEISQNCLQGKLGCFNCKKELVDKIYSKYENFRYNRKNISDEDVISILKEGSEKARYVAKQTLEEVKKAMKIKYW
jgi:tryptophanyl-tRNA synthetase